jgi:hypothetical protein
MTAGPGSTRRPGRVHGEHGQAAGIETLPFGVLVFIAGTLLVVNAWAVVTNRATADSIAREYLRSYTKETSRPAALDAGRRVVDAIVASRGLPPGRVHVDPPTAWGACAVATVTVHLTVPDIHAPFLGDLGTHQITVIHRDRIDAYRRGVASTASGQDGTPCA